MVNETAFSRITGISGKEDHLVMYTKHVFKNQISENDCIEKMTTVNGSTCN